MSVRGEGVGGCGNRQARGYVPIAGLHGNCVIVTLPAPLAWRLRERFSSDPFAPLDVAVAVESCLREVVERP